MIFKRALIVLSLIICVKMKSQIASLKASVDHLVPWSTDTLGNIYVTPSGGSAPYSYTWTPGGANPNAQNLINAPAGNYTVKVTPSVYNVTTYYYTLGYKTFWKNFFGTKQSYDSLKTTNEANFSNRTALTKNTLPASTNGWCEYIVGAYTNPYLFGFTDSTSVVSLGDQYDIDFGFHRNGSNIYAWSAGAFTSIGTSINEGDVVRLERTGSTFYLKINNVTKFTASANNKKQKIKALITTSGQLVNMGVSFNDSTAIDKMQFVVANPDHIKTDAIDSLGNLLIKEVRGGQPPYTYTWTPGPLYTRDLPDSKKNTYSVKIRDNNGDTIRRYYDIGYKAVWKNFYGTVASNDSLKSNLASGYTDRTATSVNELRPNTNGWISYIVPRYDRPMIMGFLDSVIVANQNSGNDIDFGLHLTNNNLMYAFYNLSYIYLGQAYIGDVIRLERNGSTFYLKRNNTTLYSNTAPANKKMMIKGLVNASTGVSTQLVDIGASFADSTNTTALGARAFVDHISPDGFDATGNIQLRVFGGTSPYTYTWTPGNGTSRDKLNASKGVYTIKIKDYNNTQVTYTYNIGYKANYMNKYQVTYRNDSLIPNNTVFYDKPSVTTMQLKGGKDGWVEYVLPRFTSPWVIGFLDTAYAANSTNSWDVDFAMHENNGYYYCMIGYNFYNLGTVREGDVLRLEKNGSVFSLKKNGVSQYTATASANSRYRVKATPVTAPVINIGYSFKMDADFTKDHADSLSSPFTGSISLTPYGGVPRYLSDWKWHDGVIGTSRTNMSPGSYSVEISDSSSWDVTTKVINLGVKPRWGYKRNINFTKDSLWLNRTDSNGVSVTNYVVDRLKDTWFEGYVRSMTHDVSVGFIGVTDTISPPFMNSLMKQYVDSAYKMVDKAVANTLPFTGTDSTLNLSNTYNNIHFMRMRNGVCRLLLKGNPYSLRFKYVKGDYLKLGRDVNGYIFLSRNDTVLYTASQNRTGQYLYGTIIAENNMGWSNKGLSVGPIKNVIKNSFQPYALLRKQLDGNFYDVTTARNPGYAGYLYFKFEDEYVTNTNNLTYKIYKMNRQLIATVPSLAVVYKDNRYTINITSLPGLTGINNFYILEVTDKKGEKTYLRFKY